MKRSVFIICLVLMLSLLTGCTAEGLAESLEKAYYKDAQGYHTLGDVWEHSASFNGEETVRLELEFLESTVSYFKLRIKLLYFNEKYADGDELRFDYTDFSRIVDDNGTALPTDTGLVGLFGYHYMHIERDEMILTFYYSGEPLDRPYKYIRSTIGGGFDHEISFKWK